MECWAKPSGYHPLLKLGPFREFLGKFQADDIIGSPRSFDDDPIAHFGSHLGKEWSVSARYLYEIDRAAGEILEFDLPKWAQRLVAASDDADSKTSLKAEFYREAIRHIAG